VQSSATVIHHLLMASSGVSGVAESLTFHDDEPIIRDMVHDFSEDDEHDDNSIPTSSTHPNQSFSRAAQTIQFELCEGMSFHTKEETLSAIKEYHIDQGYKFVVVESKTDRYVARCVNYEKGCQWRLRASFSKIRQQWEIKKIEASHTCLTTVLTLNYCFNSGPRELGLNTNCFNCGQFSEDKSINSC